MPEGKLPINWLSLASVGALEGGRRSKGGRGRWNGAGGKQKEGSLMGGAALREEPGSSH